MIRAAVLTVVIAIACIALGRGLGNNASQPSWIANSQEEFDIKLGLFVRVGDFGSILVMSQTQPWWTKAHPELYAAVHSPSGTVSNAGAATGGGGGGRGQQKTFMLSEMVFAPRGSSPQSPYFIATLSWEEGTELPEDNMLDYFGKVSLDMPWEYLKSYPFSHWHPTNLWGRIFIDIWEPKWAKSGFFMVAPHKDSDNDGVSDAVEILIYGSDPYAFSSGGDGMGDGWKIKYGLDPNVWLDPNADPDNDGLTNFDEYTNNTDPFNPDTDGDGYTDGWEVANGTNPLDPNDPGAAGPPAGDDIKDVAFYIYGDYAQWEMIVQGITPGGDARTLKLSTQAPGLSKSVILKLRKGNAYRITLRWIKTIAGQSQEWYCWQAQADGLPKTNTYVSYNPARIPGAAETISTNGWFMDNTDGLFTDHVHMRESSGGNVAGKLKATLYVPKIELKAYSDQLPDRTANPLPARSGDHTMYMGARNDNKGYLRVVADVTPTECAKYVRVGVRQMGTTTILTNAPYQAGEIPLSFNNAGSFQRYEVVAGLDSNADGILQPGEVSETMTNQFVLVTQSDYNSADNTLADMVVGSWLPLKTAASLLHAFRTGTTPSGATRVADLTLNSTQLSHPVGAVWDANNTAQVAHYIFGDSSSVAQTVASTSPVIGVFLKHLGTPQQSNEVRTFFANNPTVSEHTFGTWQVPASTNTLIGFSLVNTDLLFAFGHVRISGQMQVTVRGSDYKVMSFEYEGSFTDLYDFEHNGELPAPTAARAQTGYWTLGNSGKVFFTTVQFYHKMTNFDFYF